MSLDDFEIDDVDAFRVHVPEWPAPNSRRGVRWWPLRVWHAIVGHNRTSQWLFERDYEFAGGVVEGIWGCESCGRLRPSLGGESVAGELRRELGIDS